MSSIKKNIVLSVIMVLVLSGMCNISYAATTVDGVQYWLEPRNSQSPSTRFSVPLSVNVTKLHPDMINVQVKCTLVDQSNVPRGELYEVSLAVDGNGDVNHQSTIYWNIVGTGTNPPLGSISTEDIGVTGAQCYLFAGTCNLFSTDNIPHNLYLIYVSQDIDCNFKSNNPPAPGLEILSSPAPVLMHQGNF